MDSDSATSDAFGRTVEILKGSTYYGVVFDPMGNRLAAMTGQTLALAFVPLPGGAVFGFPFAALDGQRVDWMRAMG